jgi:hypothetical protein
VAKKPKPATAGEKIEMTRFGLTLDEVRNSGHKDDARRIDAAIRRAVKTERERCSRIAKQAFDGDIDAGDAWVNIANGREQA